MSPCAADGAIAADAATTAKTEEKKICRFVQMDTSSRRREKVCLTKEGWIAFNNGN